MSTTFAERLRELLETKEMSQADLSRICGLSRATLSRYLQGQFEAKQDSIYKIAKAANVSEAWLMGADVPMDGTDSSPSHASIPAGFSPVPPLVALPIVGAIACGTPITAEENIEGYTTVPERWKASFILICKGSSMEPKIHDGDVVAIRSQPDVENGQIAAVRIGEEATLKRVYHYPGRMVLQPENPEYPPIVLIGEEMNSAAIEGKAVGLCRDL